jgi:hypothetical protein
MSDVAKLFEDRERPGQWRVERLSDNGRSESKVFSGPDGLRRALRYAMQKYRPSQTLASPETAERR